MTLEEETTLKYPHPQQLVVEPFRSVDHRNRCVSTGFFVRQKGGHVFGSFAVRSAADECFARILKGGAR